MRKVQSVVIQGGVKEFTAGQAPPDSYLEPDSAHNNMFDTKASEFFYRRCQGAAAATNPNPNPSPDPTPTPTPTPTLTPTLTLDPNPNPDPDQSSVCRWSSSHASPRTPPPCRAPSTMRWPPPVSWLGLGLGLGLRLGLGLGSGLARAALHLRRDGCHRPAVLSKPGLM